MPSRIDEGAPTMTTTTTPSRFELPALNLNFGSITDGTSIPPPPASPVQKVPTPPQTPPPDKKRDVSITNGASDKPISTPPNGNLAGAKRCADEAPLSPAGSGRQGSLRRLFSRNMLNGNYAEGRLMSLRSPSVANSARPDSRGATSVMDDRKSKRSSGWFRRLRGGGDSKRSSLYFEEVPGAPPPAPTQKPAGPPPPMIPELVDLEKDEEGLGKDMFKNIK